ncbi:uncharacterized protein L969DRAFT_93604 [Mixia osmundae IAM 14324]|uniref:Cytochrome P450 n=1 Tax=Mixia osmundae (strain CBS 9802 / IAM 14324 / JCM 22182 / KY 12970) TaxID=764103 RepID=G7DUG2_MIXOS|nr:uncharacterized protein L969DRAFT_93604 [Mixia osmundae IAM 14324]KEI41095.1 hypothetical protein L969DRAFT_93604 [Mixia osmundae IAM 14324]GAA94222.1 hypothetical protein E5Q_00871 [Mixia osmundae IAM 14324]
MSLDNLTNLAVANAQTFARSYAGNSDNRESTITSFFWSQTSSSAWTTALVIIASLLILEQSVYKLKKRHLPGPSWTIPVIGRFADSLNPTMEVYKKGWEVPLSAVSVFNIFIVMASENKYTRKILNSPSYTEPCLVASAKQVLLKENWVFLNGKVHSEYRKGLNCLFTRKALGLYLETQERIYKATFEKWLADPSEKARPMQMAFRDLNMETSLRVFCGDYIPDSGAQEISDKYWLITQALELVNFPLALPGTKVYKAIQARKSAMTWLEHASAQSKLRMSAGGEPNCLVDRWIKEMLVAKKYADTSEQGEGDEAGSRPMLIREYSDHEIAMVVLSFLFASQDAMTSSITFGFQYLADYPQVLSKVREEQYRIRNNDVTAPLTLDLIDQMPYTRAVVKEVLRIRPPVIMVPYATTKAFPISDDYTVPAGTMCIPSFWNSLHDPSVYPEPDEFLPERWLEGGSAIGEGSSPKNYLVFGSGPHRCIGQEYAQLHMTAVFGTASVLMNWQHELTPESDKIKIIATIFPQDECRLKFTARPAPGRD